MKRLASIIVSSLCAINAVFAQGRGDGKMKWWKDAKFGMFIHWGIYSVPAGMKDGKTDYGEWFMKETRTPRSEYAAFAKAFNPTSFDAEDWVLLAKAAGQKYLVITTKHHDGFAMYDSQASDYNIVKATPFGRDAIKEIADACRKHGMRLGFYYSQSQDWYHPGGTGGTIDGEEWDETHRGDMDEYIDKISVPQVKEILSNYGDIDILWWDTPREMTPERAAKFQEAIAPYPDLITNNRLGGGVNGDTETPERRIPVTGFPGRNWEVCMTINEHWGYNAYDERWKPTRVLIRQLVDVVSRGGNLLLNVGPDKYGRIPQVCRTELLEIGEWLQLNGESIYGTSASPFHFLPFGRATAKGNTLYLHIYDWQREISIPCTPKIKKAHLLADKNTEIKHYKKGQSTCFRLPAYTPDKHDAVLKIEMAGPLETQDIPTAKATFSVAGKSNPQFNDNNITEYWQAETEKETIEIDLGEPVSIECLSFTEPWNVWNHSSQDYSLEANVNGKWEKLASGVSTGTGVTAPFEAVNARQFRLTIKSNQGKATTSEIYLYR